MLRRAFQTALLHLKPPPKPSCQMRSPRFSPLVCSMLDRMYLHKQQIYEHPGIVLLLGSPGDVHCKPSVALHKPCKASFQADHVGIDKLTMCSEAQAKGGPYSSTHQVSMIHSGDMKMMLDMK